MSWMNIDTARRIGKDLRDLVGTAPVSIQLHPSDDALARVTLVLRDESTGNTASKEAEETTVPSELVDAARADLKARAAATRAEIRRERRTT